MDKIEEILKKYPFFAEDIREAQEQLNKYISLQQNARDPLKAQIISREPHGSELNDQTYRAVEILIDRYQMEVDYYSQLINDILDEKKWLDKAFSALTEDERRIVYFRYDERWQVWRIMQRMGITERKSFYRIIERVKEKIKKIML